MQVRPPDAVGRPARRPARRPPGPGRAAAPRPPVRGQPAPGGSRRPRTAGARARARRRRPAARAEARPRRRRPRRRSAGGPSSSTTTSWRVRTSPGAPRPPVRASSTRRSSSAQTAPPARRSSVSCAVIVLASTVSPSTAVRPTRVGPGAARSTHRGGAPRVLSRRCDRARRRPAPARLGPCACSSRRGPPIVCAARSTAIGPDGRLVGSGGQDPSNWHVTLAFLGSVPDEELEPLVDGARAAGVGAPPARPWSGPATAALGPGRALRPGRGPRRPRRRRRSGHAVLQPVARTGDRPFFGHLTLARGPGGGRTVPAERSGCR